MKIILDDVNPADAKLMQILGAVMTQQAAQAAQQAKPQAPAPVASEQPAVVAVPDPEPETEDPEVTEEEIIDNTESPEVDADGVEWNEELHASTKTKTADGRWKKRRGAAKKAEEKPDPAAIPKSDAAPVDFETYRIAIETHKGALGLIEQKGIFGQLGIDSPSAAKPEQYGTIVDALNNDKGPVTEGINLDEFC